MTKLTETFIIPPRIELHFLGSTPETDVYFSNIS